MPVLPYHWAANPQAQAYASRNPNGIFARLFRRDQGAGPPGGIPASNHNSVLMHRGVASFEAGGMMSAQGTAIRPGAPMQGAQTLDEPQMGADQPMPMDGGQIEQEAQNFVKSNPQVVQKLQAVLVHAMQSGDLTSDELNLVIQLAKAALANPASYPQVRAFAIKNGLGSEADIPQELDRGLLFTLIVAGKAMQAAGGGQAAMQNAQAQGQPKAGLLPEYSQGGMTGDKKHLAELHPDEYVVPKDVVMYHGKKHMDKLVEQARAPKDANQGS